MRIITPSLLIYCTLSAVSSVYDYSESDNKIELDVEQNELIFFKRAISELKNSGIKLKGFYHASMWTGAPYWRDVIKEQMQLMDGMRVANQWSNDPSTRLNRTYLEDMENMHRTQINLLEQTDQLYFNIVGEQSSDFFTIKDYVETLDLKFKDKIYFNFNKTLSRGAFSFAEKTNNFKEMENLRANHEISEGESSTIMTLQKYCKNEISQGRKAYIYYLHSKGGCCIRGKQKVLYDIEPVASWREEMNTFIIEFPSICLRALNAGYSTCGVELKHHYYAGNFWWANCEHIASLPELSNRFDACCFNEGQHHYNHECKRSSYEDIVKRYASQYEQTFSMTDTITGNQEQMNSTIQRLKKCRELSKIAYTESDFYSSGNKDHILSHFEL